MEIDKEEEKERRKQNWKKKKESERYTNVIAVLFSRSLADPCGNPLASPRSLFCRGDWRSNFNSWRGR